MDKMVFRKERITILRESKGLDVSQFASRIGTTSQQVERWENGTNNPSLDSLVDMCNAFQVVPGYFFVTEPACGISDCPQQCQASQAPSL